MNRIRIKIIGDERQLDGSRSLKRINKYPGQLFYKNRLNVTALTSLTENLMGFATQIEAIPVRSTNALNACW